MSDVGAYLANLRKSRGLSQEKLAEAAGVDRSYIAMIETGRRSPSWRFLATVANALHIPITDLLRAAGLIEQSAVDEGELAALLRANPDFAAVFEYARTRPDILPDLARYARFLIQERGDGGEPGSGSPD